MAHPTLKGWVPFRIDWQALPPAVEWCYLGRQHLVEPFFDQTISATLQRPFGLLFRQRTTLPALAEIASAGGGLEPSGFVFHMSRCGSTLISRMLAALPRTIMVSEPRIIDSILRNGPRHFRADLLDGIGGMIAALGRPRLGDESYYVIKFDCTHITYFDVISRAFPRVPWVFLVRDPVEVLVSQLQRMATNLVQGSIPAHVLGLGDSRELSDLSRDEHCARALGAICRAGSQALAAGGGLSLNFRQLPEAVVTTLAQHFGIALSPSDRQRMLEVSQFHAKDPSRLFNDDSLSKQTEATTAIRDLVDRWVRPQMIGI
jgi:hypothetical protein